MPFDTEPLCARRPASRRQRWRLRAALLLGSGGLLAIHSLAWAVQVSPAVESGVAASGRRVSIDELKTTCRAAEGNVCQITIASPITTELRGVKEMPASYRVTILGQGSWTVNGGVLDFAGAKLDAPGDRQIFYGNGTVRGLAEARPEWFAQADGDAYAPTALRLAYEAAVPSGTILLREGVYVSPFFDAATGSCGGEALWFSSPRLLLGVRRPVPDSPTQPTRLVGGSVVRGEICAGGRFRAAHVGVDEGPYAIAHNFHGKGAFGVQIISRPLGSVSGSVLDDVSVLTTAVESQHSVVIEGQQHATIRHLWIWSLGGTHGLVVKSFASAIEDFHCSGASADCLILKSDYATDHQGDASDDRLSGVYLRDLAQPGDTGGILLDARWDSLRRIEMNDLKEDGLTYGIAGADSLLHSLADVHIRQWTATNMRGPCLNLEGGRRVTLEAVSCSGPGIERGGGFLYHRFRFVLKPFLRILWTQFTTVLRDGTASEHWVLVGLGCMFAIGCGLVVRLVAAVMGLRRAARAG